jgi:pimeloyl-ACP methyl ester carboxylesterase
MTEAETVTYPGARRPDRIRRVDSHGLSIATYEWGAEDAPPLLLAHGGFDFAGTFDVFAPLLADGGWRVVAWDHRGCGDSEHAALYSWSADVRDALAVLDTVADAPIPFIGHSKGGGVMLQLAESSPHRVSKLVLIDGLPSPHAHPDIADHERTRLLARDINGWLDHRRRVATNERKPDTLDGLAARRRRMNPRLSMEWLRYLVTIGGRKDADGWRWKIDPAMRPGGFGPWRPSWALERLPGLGAPMLGMTGGQPEPMGWGTTPEMLAPYLPAGARLVPFEDTGHFIHIEQPERVADLTLEFLAS